MPALNKRVHQIHAGNFECARFLEPAWKRETTAGNKELKGGRVSLLRGQQETRLEFSVFDF